MDGWPVITQAQGNLLEADVDALVNTVNTVGVMGKGIALQFKRAYPEMFREYARLAKLNQIDLGRMHVWRTGLLSGPRLVINFPTKGHWRAKSRLQDIEAGLADLVRVIQAESIKSIAIPPLGCGNGGLSWSTVEPVIRATLSGLVDVDVIIYSPGAAPAATEMHTATQRPRITAARAALISLLAAYGERAMDTSLIEIQKLLYFLQVAGEPLRLNYVRGHYGPYADNLRHTLLAMEGHQLTGFGDGSARVNDAEPIRITEGAADEASDVLKAHTETLARIDRVLRLSEGFESAYGLELLATVHWVAHESTPILTDPSEAHRLVRDWSVRKGELFTPLHVEVAWAALVAGGWLPASAA